MKNLVNYIWPLEKDISYFQNVFDETNLYQCLVTKHEDSDKRS
jgi:hypothetical protein